MTHPLAPALFGALGGPEPVHNVIATILAIVGAAACAVLVLAFRSVVRLRSDIRL
jgi:hypothetical protein